MGSAPGPEAFSQEEVFKNKLPVPPSERTAAGAAGYFAIICLRPSLRFDDLIESTAFRTREWIECRWLATRHDTPPIPNSWLLLARICLRPPPRNCHSIVTPKNHAVCGRKLF